MPAAFWKHPTMVEALTSQHMGQVTRAWRNHPDHGRHVVSQDQVATWAGITQPQLSRIETGAPSKNLDDLVFWADLLHVPAEWLWFALPGQPPPALATAVLASQAVDENTEATSTTNHDANWQGQGVQNTKVGHQLSSSPSSGGRHRVLLQNITEVAASSGLLGPSGREQAGLRRLGPNDVVRLNAVTALYRSVDYERGGGLLYNDAARFAVAVSALLDHPFPDALAPDLLSAVAAARQLAGWAAFDSCRHSDAARHFLAAERAAIAAGDLLLAARVRYCQARQFQHLHHNRDALDTIRLARDHLGSASTPAVSALLDGAEAASLAALGDRDTAVRMLGAASDYFERIVADDEPDWMLFYDQGELLAQYGRVYRDLARVDSKHGPDAVRWVTQAINGFGAQNIRSSVLNQVGLTSALFLNDEPDHAVVVGTGVITQAQNLTSQRVFDRIVNLRRDLIRYHNLPQVAAFAQTLTTLTPAPVS
jgi:transcriptional regulator with XRE-family HTH domain